MNTKRFLMLNEDFLCENCLESVEPLKGGARDHCPYCLFSKHVDIFPGDRQNTCEGLMQPIAVEKFRNTYKIVYKCRDCDTIHKNIMAKDDNFEEILKLMQHPQKY